VSALGPTEKNSVRANVFRVVPESGPGSMQSACLKGANSGPHAAAEWIIGIQHNSGATEAWVWAIDNVMLLLHPGVV
jgi:hypothetical protein